MTNLTLRDTTPEIMDDFSLPSSTVDPVLEGLDRMNMLFGGCSDILRALKYFNLENHYSIADWGCGGGETLRTIARWGIKNGLKIKLTGVDAAPAVVKYAKQQSAAYANIRYVQGNVLDEQMKDLPCDVIISSLFTHHFTDDELVRLFQNMNASARKGIIITDLHRHPILYYAVVFITRLFTRSEMARNDGPLSVKRAFKRQELEIVLKRAQINNYKLTWRWPFRWRVIVSKS